ncbi:MAG: DNA adenine methylase [Sulfurihydrogenibium sp.]|nr:DNA adenine methylase [Sulfurihydrogenibium sp.]
MSKKLNFFPYMGGKSFLVDTIIKLILEHKIYVEPFGGSAKVLLNKPPSKIEVYNDADLRLSNLFYVVAFKFSEFEEKINRLVYSRALYRNFFNELKPKNLTFRELGDVDLAVKTYFTITTSFNGKINANCFKVDYSRGGAKTFFNSLNKLEAIHNRLKNVVIEYLNYDKILEKYLDRNDAFVYLDPPYFGTEHYYDVEFTFEDHKKMIEMLKVAKAKWLLSGYSNELYDKELKNFYKLEIPAVKNSYGITKVNKHTVKERPKVIEILWANYEIKL